MFLTVSLSIPFDTFLQCFPKAVAEAEIILRKAVRLCLICVSSEGEFARCKERI